MEGMELNFTEEEYDPMGKLIKVSNQISVSHSHQ